MMKKFTLAASALIIGLSSAYAADGTITINGQVTDQTCTITTPAGKDFTVTLPTVSKSTLNASGKTAGRTPFEIQLSNCSVGSVATYFEPGVAVDLGTGRLKNQSTSNPAATGVQVQLLGDNAEFLPIKGISPGSAQSNSQWKTITTAGEGATLNYFAEYYATGAATAGEVKTLVEYTLMYK
mgnify:CR=1 FL=1